MFQSRKIVIATMHQKEKVIEPLLEDNFKLQCTVPSGFDSDSLGTFSGEIERKSDPITTLRQKCLLAIEKTNLDLAIASEGSFGAHPSLFFAQGNDELVMLFDKKNNLEIVARELSLETNFSTQIVKTYVELEDFAKKALFPSHGLILRKNKTDYSVIFKGITDSEDLKRIFKKIHSENGEVLVETDMRALFNPTRMKNIEKATVKLIEKMKSLCPKCDTPGFEITQVISGLPCELCGNPTASTWKFKKNCKKCDHEELLVFPNGKRVESPEYCNTCNP